MTPIAWVLFAVGVGAIIEGYHGHGIWQDILDLFSGKQPGSSSSSTTTTGTLP